MDVMGDDKDIALAARVSYDRDDKHKGHKKLINYLIKHEHTSPFEMVEFKFMVKTPLFVARQWFRHRTGNYNEISQRYTTMENPDFFVPDPFRQPSSSNKQASVVGDFSEAEQEEMQEAVIASYKRSLATYESLLSRGVTREQARSVLPLGIFTRFVFKIDLHNLMRFIRLRASEHAQWEIQQYARAIIQLISPHVPDTLLAFAEHVVKEDATREFIVQTVSAES